MKILEEFKAAKRVEQAIARQKHYQSQKELADKAKELSKKYGVSTKEAEAYLRLQARRQKRKQKLIGAHRELSRVWHGMQKLANQYERNLPTTHQVRTTTTKKKSPTKKSKKKTTKTLAPTTNSLSEYANNMINFWKL